MPTRDTPIPSKQWLRLQFAPKTPTAASALQYTGSLNVRYTIQARQFRKEHLDSHYASAVFRYEKDMAVKFRKYSNFVAMDDKHACKVGEPGFPVAAVERGKRVLVAADKKMAVGDHDFTKFTQVPSVTFSIAIPQDVTGSFYDGQVHVGVKDHVFQRSTPVRHTAELSHILTESAGEHGNVKEILFFYTDGGPDHRLTYKSVQICLFTLFIKHDLDMLVAARTPPHWSWKDPAERIMSILNLGLQCVGLMRAQMDEKYETKIASCGGLAQLRAKSENDPDLQAAIADSLEVPKVCDILKYFNVSYTHEFMNILKAQAIARKYI